MREIPKNIIAFPLTKNSGGNIPTDIYKQILADINGLPRMRCPVCRSRGSWELDDNIVLLPQDPPWSAQYLPCLAILCNQCAYVRLHQVRVSPVAHKYIFGGEEPDAD